MCLHFIAYFAVCENTKKNKGKKQENKKKMKKKPNFGCSHLGNGLNDFLLIWNVDFPSWRSALQQIWFQSDKVSLRYKGVKMMFSFFLEIYPRCGAWLLGLHDTLMCVLIYLRCGAWLLGPHNILSCVLMCD